MRYIDGPRKRQFGVKSEVFRSGRRTPSGKRAQTPASKGDGEPAAGDADRTEKATSPPDEGTLTDRQVAEKKEDVRRSLKMARRCQSARITREGRPKSSVYRKTTGSGRVGSRTSRKQSAPQSRPKTRRGWQREVETETSARDVVVVESGAKSQTLQFLAEAMDGVYDADSGDSNAATAGDSADAMRKRDNGDTPKETGRSSGDDPCQGHTPRVIPLVTRQESSTQTTATEDTGMKSKPKPKPKPVTSSTGSQAGDGIPIDIVVTVEDAPSVRSDGTASVEGEKDVEAVAVDPGKDKNSQTMEILAGDVTEVTESRQVITADEETREISGRSARITEHDTTQAVTDTPRGVTGVGESATDVLEMHPTETGSPQDDVATPDTQVTDEGDKSTPIEVVTSPRSEDESASDERRTFLGRTTRLENVRK